MVKKNKILTISSSLDRLRNDLVNLNLNVKDQVEVGDYTYDLEVNGVLIDVVSLFASEGKEYSEFNDSSYRTGKLINANKSGYRLITYFDFYPYDIFFDFVRSELKDSNTDEYFAMTYNYDFLDENTIIINDIICNETKLTEKVLKDIVEDLNKRNNFTKVISYVDLNLYDKTVFERAGFKEIRKTISPKMLLISGEPYMVFDCGQSKMEFVEE